MLSLAESYLTVFELGLEDGVSEYVRETYIHSLTVGELLDLARESVDSVVRPAVRP